VASINHVILGRDLEEVVAYGLGIGTFE